MSLTCSEKVLKEVPKHIAGYPDLMVPKFASYFGPTSDFLLFHGLSEH